MQLAELGGLVVVLLVLLALDVRFFAHGREATFRESVVWSTSVLPQTSGTSANDCWASCRYWPP